MPPALVLFCLAKLDTLKTTVYSCVVAKVSFIKTHVLETKSYIYVLIPACSVIVASTSAKIVILVNVPVYDPVKLNPKMKVGNIGSWAEFPAFILSLNLVALYWISCSSNVCPLFVQFSDAKPEPIGVAGDGLEIGK